MYAPRSCSTPFGRDCPPPPVVSAFFVVSSRKDTRTPMSGRMRGSFCSIAMRTFTGASTLFTVRRALLLHCTPLPPLLLTCNTGFGIPSLPTSVSVFNRPRKNSTSIYVRTPLKHPRTLVYPWTGAKEIAVSSESSRKIYAWRYERRSELSISHLRARVIHAGGK